MSSEGAAADVDTCCANCGITEVDNVKLLRCACLLVKYCGVECQKNHRPQHKKACKKRLAEVREVKLFEQPGKSCLGECPICCLPLPLDPEAYLLMSCCSQTICAGCLFANGVREGNEGLERKCVFCREPVPKSRKEGVKMRMQRVKAKDPVAMLQVGNSRYLEGRYDDAFQYLTQSAELGEAEAHFQLSELYEEGLGVEKNMKKYLYHLEEAAIGGHPKARHKLGLNEAGIGRDDRAMKHFIIAASHGNDDSLEGLEKYYECGLLAEEDYAAARRTYQAAVDATKSLERKKVNEAIQRGEISRL